MLQIKRTAVRACIVIAATATSLNAQVNLAGSTESGFGPVFNFWRLGGGGISQPTIDGATTVHVTRVTQWSIPIAIAVPIGSKWSVDVTGAYAMSDVNIAEVDPVTNTTSYSLSGLTDLRIRATGHLVGDNILITAGLNVPTGKTELDEEELSALRVVGAPALSLQVPVLGVGTGGTLGLVFAGQLGGWATALGTSYELRRQYTPISLAAGIPVDFSPGDAIRVSLGTSRLIGQNNMTFGLSGDFFAKEELESNPSGSVAVGRSQLGPIYTADWQFEVATRRLRELTFYVVDRYRTEYKRDGTKVPDSDGNYLDAGVRAVAGVTPSTGVLVGINGRHHTGLGSDDFLTTAAVASGSLTLGVMQRLGSNYSLQPFVRVQGGRLKSGDESSTISGFTGGLTLGVRF